MGACDTCRFSTEGGGCSEGVCGEVRSELRGRGIPVRPGGLKRATPELMTPDGLIGFRVDCYMFPPTLAGYKDARCQQGQLEQYAVTDLELVARYDRELPAGPVMVWEGANLVPVVVWNQPKGATA